MVFLSKKFDGNMIFTDCWKSLVLNFSVMGNTVFFSAKMLMERLYIPGLFELSMIFQKLENVVFPAVLRENKVIRNWYYRLLKIDVIFQRP